MPGRQIRVDFKIEQTFRVAIILHGKFLSMTGFREVNFLLGMRKKYRNYERTSEVAVRSTSEISFLYRIGN